MNSVILSVKYSAVNQNNLNYMIETQATVFAFDAFTVLIDSVILV